jgi:hypothetical protein
MNAEALLASLSLHTWPADVESRSQLTLQLA